MKWRRVSDFVVVFAIFFIAGCAAPTRVNPVFLSESSHWSGRLAVRIDSDPPRSLSAGFELVGSARAGELTFYTPLGSTAAALTWSEQAAIMRTPGEVRHFDSLEALIAQAIGTDLPVAALFSWLAGTPVLAAGWQADLTDHSEGRITAHRATPPPVAELRVALDR